jgi:hypothetical protein
MPLEGQEDEGLMAVPRGFARWLSPDMKWGRLNPSRPRERRWSGAKETSPIVTELVGICTDV